MQFLVEIARLCFFWAVKLGDELVGLAKAGGLASCT